MDNIRSFLIFLFSSMLLLLAAISNAQTQVVGNIPGVFNVSSSGAAEYTIPISVSPGTAGTAPSLSISYNSNASTGILGAGWTLDGISTITRGPKSHYTDGVVDGVRLLESDALYLDGVRLIEVAVIGSGINKRIEYRKETDDITRIYRYGASLANASFIVQTKGGVTLKFDGSKNSTPLLADGTPILWAVSRIYDTPGNFIEFHYLQNGQGDYAVSTIRYAGHEEKDRTGNIASVKDPYASVNFDYETLSRPVDTYVAGRLIRRAYRLKSIASRVSTARDNGSSAGWPLLTRYEFKYDDLVNHNRFVLASVRQFGDDGTEMHPTQFTYSKPQLGWKDGNFQLPIAVLAGEEKLSRAYRFAYLGGGATNLADMLFSALIEGKLESFAFKNQGGNWAPEEKFKPPFAFVSADGADLGAIVLDLNGDGRSDLIQSYQASGQAPNINAYVATDGGWQGAGGYKIPFIASLDGKRSGKFIFASFSGSGRPDLIYEVGGVRGFLVNTGSQWQNDPVHVPPVSLAAAARSIDVDCDGRLELVAPVGSGWKAYRFDAAGWTPMPTAFDLPLPGNLPDAAIAQLDINADGHQDLIVTSPQSNIRKALIADAAGWKEDNSLSPKFDLVDQNGAEIGAIVTDVNSDGKLDVIANRIAADGQAIRYAFAQSSTGWADLGASFFVPPLLELQQNAPDKVALVGNIDGDGTNDIATPSGARNQFGRIFAGTSGGFVEKPQYVPNVAIARKNQQDYGVRFADLNADGLPDVIFRRDVTKEGTTTKVEGAYINTGNGWQAATGLTPPQPIAADWISGNPMQLIDVDGDGFIDMLYNYRKADGTTLRGYYRNMEDQNGSRRWEEQPNSSLMPPLNYPFAIEKGGDQGVRFVDLNGDALVDMVASVVNPRNPHNPGLVENCTMVNGRQVCTLNRTLFSGTAFLNNGTGWTQTAGYTSPVPFVAKPDRASEATKNLFVDIMDIDGDRLPDLVARFKHPHKETLEVSEIWLNTGSGWQSSAIKLPVALDVPNNNDRASFQWFDVNADGLEDLLYTERVGNVNLSRTWLSTGNGFILSAPWAVPIEALADQVGDQGFRMADIDGDGLLDIIYSRLQANAQHVRGVFLNNGSTWIAADPKAVDKVPAFINNEGHDQGVRLVDVDGNGLPDIIQAFNKSDGAAVERQSFLSKGRRSDVLLEVLPGYSVKTSIDYQTLLEVPPSPPAGKGTPASPWPRVYKPAPSQCHYPYLSPVPTTYVVSQTTKEIPGNVTHQFFRYGDFRLHATALQPLGFGWREVYDVTSGIVSQSEYAREIEKAGRTLRETSYLANFSGSPGAASVGVAGSAPMPQKNKLNETILSWNFIDFTPGIISPTRKIRQVYLENTTTKTWELDDQLVAQETTKLTYDAPQVAYLDRRQNVTFTDVSRLDGTRVETENEYSQEDPQHWLLGRLTKATVKKTGDSAPTGNAATGPKKEQRVTTFTYDPMTGLLQSSTIEPGNPKAVTTTYERDQYGNIKKTILSATGMKSRTSSSDYDALGRFVLEEYNDLGHKVIFKRNGKTGAPAEITDPNNFTTTYTYDGFGRLETETSSSGVVIKTKRLKSADIPSGAADGLKVAYAEQVTVGTLPSELHLYDAMGRLVRNITAGFTPNASLSRWVHVDFVYDNVGRMHKQSLPYERGRQPLWQTMTHDALNRIIEVSKPNGGKVKTVFTGKAGGGRLVSAFDEMGRRTLTELNTRELPISVVDQQNGRVSYEYDAGDRLQIMMGPTGALTKTKYNLFGQREEVDDPDLGIWKYEYDAFGQLVKQTDAKTQITKLEYDDLGRLKVKTLADGTEHKWKYDGAGKGVGKVESVSGSDGYEQSFYYDDYGRPYQTVVKILTSGGKEPFTTTTELDKYGRLWKKHFPVPNKGGSPFIVEYVYDAKGFLTGVKKAGETQVYWQALDIDESGRVRKEKFGNGVETKTEYSINTGELEGILAKRATGNRILDLTLKYDDVGNLRTRQEAVQNISETFTYDALNRLESAKKAGQATIRYEYDAAGRIRRKAGVRQFSYWPDAQSGTKQPYHAVIGTQNGTNLKKYVYDANGNRKSENGKTFDYTADNLLLGVEIDIRHWVKFDYDPWGNRYRQRSMDGLQAYEILDLGEFEQERQRESHHEVSQSHTTRLRYHLSNGSGTFLIIEKKIDNTSAGAPSQNPATEAGTTNTWYLHKDQLGSVVRVTNEAGILAVSYWYEPWGKRDNPRVSTAGQNFGASRRQGFTGHEQLATMGLIHMNGRVYDYETGMFLSADPVDLVTGYTQTLGRYSYALNNPFRYTDPTGLRWKPGRVLKGAIIGLATGGIGGAIAGGIIAGVDRSYKIVKENWREAAIVTVAVGVTVATGGAGAIVAGMAAGAAAGATRAALYGGDASNILEGAIKGGVIGGVSGAFSIGVEQAFSGVSGTLGGQLGEMGAQSVVSGGMSEIEGGNFWTGFASTAITQASNAYVPQFSGVSLNVVRAAVVGGTLAEISGGKFANGAIISAFSYALSTIAENSRSNGRSIASEGQVVFQSEDEYLPENFGFVSTTIDYTDKILSIGGELFNNADMKFMGNIVGKFGNGLSSLEAIAHFSNGYYTRGAVSLISMYPPAGYTVSVFKLTIGCTSCQEAQKQLKIHNKAAGLGAYGPKW